MWPIHFHTTTKPRSPQHRCFERASLLACSTIPPLRFYFYRSKPLPLDVPAFSAPPSIFWFTPQTKCTRSSWLPLLCS